MEQKDWINVIKAVGTIMVEAAKAYSTILEEMEQDYEILSIDRNSKN